MTTFDRFQWQNAWIDDPRVPCELISVLAVLFRYINSHGTCYPSQMQIANHLQKTVRTVQRRLALIEDLGYLERSGGHTYYRAKIPITNTTPMSSSASMDTTPMSSDTTPMSHEAVKQHDTHVACTNEYTTPMSSDTTPMSHEHDTHVALTVQEQSKEQSSSSSSLEIELEVFEKPKNQNQPPQQPAEILAELCQSADINITVFQAESLWAQVRSQLIDHDTDDVWNYFRWKLSDLQGTEYPVRAKLKFLNADVPKWLDIQRKRNVGRNDFSMPEPASEVVPIKTELDLQPAATPAVDTDTVELARQLWSAALPTLQASVSRKNFMDWFAPLTPIGIEQATFHLDAGDGFKAAYIEDTYHTLILDALTAVGEVVAVKFHPELSI